MAQENRVVVLIDMDCFYCQVEEKLDPTLEGKPIAVVQYNPWKGGGIIAVNYIARARGVTRHMRGDEAKEKCPELELPSVPCFRGKADITRYRDAGISVAKVLQKFTPLLERASIDEAYLDITAAVQQRLNTLNANSVTTDMIPNTFALGYDSIEEFMSDIHSCGSDSIDFDYEHAKQLLIGAVIVSEIRAAVYEETGYRCSAGIAHNKILAKLVCGMNKPNKQTVLPKHCINILYKTLSIKKVKHLGGKFGDTVCDVLKISKMAELQNFTEKELQNRFDDKNGTWLYNIARGIDFDPVQARFNPKSIGCCKQLRGKSALQDLDSLRRWLKDLGDEIEDRLEKDALETNRTPKQMVVSFTVQLPDGRDTSSSRSYNFAADDELCGDLFSSKALELVMESAEGVKVKDNDPNRKLSGPIKFLGISVGKFEDLSESKKTRKILDYFGAGSSNIAKSKDVIVKQTTDDAENRKGKRNDGKGYILQKFFQVTDKKQESKTKTLKEENVTIKSENLDVKFEPPIESTLDKQESFFAKFLNSKLKKGNDNSETDIANVNEALRPTTPVCNVVNCGEDSNDTDYTGSTIDMEINKSIALFEDDPQDVARVSSIRDLLAPTVNESKSEEDLPPDLEKETSKVSVTVSNIEPTSSKVANKQINVTVPNIETFECPECKKAVSISRIEEHADYHLALRLREEERQQVRKEIKEFKQKKENDKRNNLKEETEAKKPAEEQKNETSSSIVGFLVKLDNTTPVETCAECGKKVPVEKFAEHLDFHEAQKLSRDLNKKSTPGHFATNSIKRKRKTVSPVKKQKVPCTTKSIDSFFR